LVASLGQLHPQVLSLEAVLFKGGRSVALFASPYGGTSCHVCSSDGVAVDSASVVPWSGFTSYEWMGDTLVLHRTNRFVRPKTLSGTVASEQRAAAESLLASCLTQVAGREITSRQSV